ncbi:MAG: T9SS type A sorting domain-containing protein [bacterium]
MKKLNLLIYILLLFTISLNAQEKNESRLLQKYTPIPNPSMGNPNRLFETDASAYTSRWFGWTYEFSSTLTHIVKSNLNTPGILTNIGPPTKRIILGGAIAGDGIYYGLEYITEGEGNLVKIDTITGSITTIGELTGLVSGQIVTGMAWDKTANKMFAVAGSSASTLYTVNLTNGALTIVVNQIIGSDGVIDIAINSKGVLYSWDIFTDNLYTIDKTTGVATLVGPLGINILSAQGGGFDPETDSLFLAALVVPENFAALYRCNTSTGATSYIGDFGTQFTEVDAFVIPFGESYQLNSFNLQSPVSGARIVTVPGSTEVVNISWDTSATGASYKFIFGNPALPPRRFSISSPINSVNTTLGKLDSILSTYGFTNNGSSSDSASGQWDVWAFKGPNAPGPDSLKSLNGPRSITFRRQQISLVPFALNAPVSGITIVTSPISLDDVRFDWQSSAPGAIYNWLYKSGSSYSDPATIRINSNHDTILNIKSYKLDSILSAIGVTPGDSVSGYWKVRAYNSSDSLNSLSPDRLVTFRRSGLLPLLQTFTDPLFPPLTWSLDYTGNLWWSRQAGLSSYGSTSGGCALFNIWNAPAGTLQSLISNQFVPVSSNSIKLKFDLTHAYYLDGGLIRNDSLIIYSSTDGGITYLRVAAYGANLNLFESLSTTASQSNYVPSLILGSHWGTKSISIPVGTNKIKFEAKSDYGNNLYIDSIRLLDTLVGISNELNQIPDKYTLEQNFPNPFNPNTIIQYQLPASDFVSLKIFNILGKEVAVLVNEKQNAGTYSVEFDGSNLSSGVYFYRLQTEGFVETKRMALIK